MTPTVFISYSHDSELHKDWVLQLATRLRANGVDVLLDRWNLKLGQDLASFMERGLSSSNRVLCICTEDYIKKSNAGMGGAGYEKQIITAELLSDLNTNWIIPVVRNNLPSKKVPTFLASRLYIDFNDDNLYESHYEEVLRDLLDEPILPIPPLGSNPFETIKKYAEQKFIPSNEKYVSPAVKGRVTFDYSNNNGRYYIGQDNLAFELDFSKSSDENIQLYNDPTSIKTVAIAKDKNSITEINDARVYDGSSKVRRPKLNQIAVLQNTNGFYAAIKILSIKDDTRGAEYDEVIFDYIIQTDGSPDFTSLA
ncbi:toll/interleukin-1 receptor domain-containing protein [Providencia huaxiensis]|uniref:toll/interleukin-1 receptor domain-containing protein n=1 Tax=Providencia huaxiensis TaxID=2027290 RepID=UPI0032DB038B